MTDIHAVRERLTDLAVLFKGRGHISPVLDQQRADLRALLADHARLVGEVSKWRPMTPDIGHVGPAWCAVRVFSAGKFLEWDIHYVEIDDETGQITPDFHQGWEIEDYEFWMPVAPPEPPFDGGEAVHSQQSDQAPAELRIVRDWLSEIATIDLEAIVADGGVTAGMVVQQEARGMAERIARCLPPQPTKGA